MTGDPIKIAQDLIRCRSITPVDAGVQDALIAVLEPAGFSCHRLEFDGINCLFARYGTAAPHICFAGHTDVVDPGNEASWTYPPFAAEIQDGLLYGRGAIDMKSGTAAFAAAALRYLQQNDGAAGSISFLIAGDEEDNINIGTARTLEWMKENGHIPDGCIVGEATSLNEFGDMIKVGRRGSLTGKIAIKGKQGHVAYPDRACNPLPVMGRVMRALEDLVLDAGNQYFQPSNLEWLTIDTGNPAGNVTPESVTGLFNIRFNDEHNHETLEKLLCRKIYQACHPEQSEGSQRVIEDEILHFVQNDKLAVNDVTISLEWTRGAESFFSPPAEFATLVQDAVESVVGLRPALDTIGGSSDARFVYKYCPVLEFGPLCGLAHHVDEAIPLDHIEKTTAIYEQVLERFFKN